MPDASLALIALLGGALAAGYAGHLVFRRFRVSDVSVLIALGLLAGPILGLVDPGPLAPAIPFLSPLALVVVLFEGGLELAWEDIRAHAPRALRMALTTWALTGALVGLAAWWALGLAPAVALLFGYAVAATGMLVVIPLLQQVGAPNDARVMLTVETSLGDLLSAVLVTTAAGIMVAHGSAQEGLGLLGARFLVGGAVGLLAGLGWARVLHAWKPERHGYMVTLAALLLAYVAAQALGGSGYLAALAFGLTLGNAPALMRLGGLDGLAALPAASRGLQNELIFLLRSVYFVFLGLSIPRGVLTPGFALAGVALLAALLVARVVGVVLTARRSPSRGLLVAMMPRGLATAVIAAIPVAMGVPGTAVFPAACFLVILAADLATSVGLWWVSRKAAAPAAVAEPRLA